MSVGNNQIRWANAYDAEELVKLNQAFNGVEVTIEEVKNSLALSSELIALAILNNVAVGFICAQYYKSFCYRELQGEITELFVEVGARRKGLAFMLLKFIEEEFKTRGVKTVKVLTGHTNEQAIKVYEKLGYISENEVLLQKQL